MFVIKKVHEYDWPVTAQVPADGGLAPAKFTLRFRVPATPPDLLRPARDLLLELIVGWTDVVDEKGKEISFHAPALEQALDLPFFSDAALRALEESWYSRRGNASGASAG